MAGLFMGIDPGTTGAVSVYNPEDDFCEVFDIPFFEIQVGLAKSKRKKIDIPSLLSLLSDNGNDRIVSCVLESVTARPHDSKVAAFAFGEAFGSIKGCLAAALIPYELVTPQTWKKEFKLTGKDGGGDDKARETASRLLPSYAGYFSRKKDHNRADAALLSIYAARCHKK